MYTTVRLPISASHKVRGNMSKTRRRNDSPPGRIIIIVIIFFLYLAAIKQWYRTRGTAIDLKPFHRTIDERRLKYVLYYTIVHVPPNVKCINILLYYTHNIQYVLCATCSARIFQVFYFVHLSTVFRFYTRQSCSEKRAQHTIIIIIIIKLQ